MSKTVHLLLKFLLLFAIMVKTFYIFRVVQNRNFSLDMYINVDDGKRKIYIINTLHLFEIMFK